MSQKRQSEIFTSFFKKKKVDDNSTLTNENILNETASQQEPAVYTNLSEINDTKEYDIGFAVEEDSNVKIRKEISQLYNYLCKTWTPNKKYVFPVTKDKNGNKKVIAEHLPTSKSVILIKLCETRWVESHEAILRFSDMLLPIVIFLEDIIGNADGNILAKCNGLLQSVLNFEFILSLEVAVEILSITLPISRQLQNPDLDLTKCIEIIDLMREDTKFTAIFNRAVSKAGVLNIDVKIPRICKRQAHRSNFTTSSTEEYFKVTVYFTVLDNFITSIQTMFLDNQNNIVFKIQQLIPNYLNAHSEEEILKGASFYESDLPGTLNELKEKKSKIITAMEAFKETEGGYFPNIRQLLLILAVLPVTTSTSERSFSTLKRIKSYLRTTMEENRLNGLSLLNIHYQIDIKPEEVIDLFAKQHSRRLQFCL
ncbi:52 kDa repressor of the inhibitor of the protein kinase-like [Rhopalosiphum padi]|uniref:52 kDa repressor of the inhibitor of the protein kinase-like n=1 Tax=Rhopalosiphum padi TaxID=40932 RepID=UPI00298E9A78|nr:52 kDa repressor of the inhibitor of the protein kinase-like [Rhopalosiphum padi]